MNPADPQPDPEITRREAEALKRQGIKQNRELSSSGIMPRHQRIRHWDDLTDPGGNFAATIEQLKAFRFDGMMAMIGPRGTGKTQYGAILGCDFIRADKSVRMLTVCRLLSEIKATFKGTRPTEEVVRGFETVDLLILDEWQVKLGTDWEDMTITNILDTRYGHELATVIISNLDPEAFAVAAGASIVDRLRQCGGIVICDWQSLREPKS